MAGIQQTVKIVKAFKALAPEVGKPRVLEHALGEMRIIRSGGKAVLCKNGKVVRNLTETEYQLAHEAEIIAEALKSIEKVNVLAKNEEPEEAPAEEDDAEAEE